MICAAIHPTPTPSRCYVSVGELIDADDGVCVCRRWTVT